MSRRLVHRAATAVGAGFCGTSLVIQRSNMVSAQASSPATAESMQFVLSQSSNRAGVRAFSSAAAVAAMAEPFAAEVSKLPTEAQAVLRFWYPDMDSGDCKMQRFWFAGGKEDDDNIRSQFGELVEQALSGGLSEWETTHAGCVAKILLLDQFPRNLFRGSAKAFAGDQEAQRLIHKLLSEDPDFPARGTLPLPVRMFALIPLEHSESRENQQLMIENMAIATFKSPARKELMSFAWEHQGVVARFGRFPHRNKPLGRENTPQEEAYLNSDGSKSWGQ